MRMGKNNTTFGKKQHVSHSYDEMARRFLPGYAAHVSDVEAAFPMLPFAPWVWPFMLHRFYRGEGPELS
jgi:hypothetical protein